MIRAAAVVLAARWRARLAAPRWTRRDVVPRSGVLGAVVAVGMAAGLWAARGPATAAVWEHPYFTINQLVINGGGPALTPDDLRAWLGFTGESTLWEASPARVRARLEAHPYVARAVVRREFPGRLDVLVHERRPQAIAVLDDLFYVDRHGVTFGPLRPRDSRDYPLITGLAPRMADGPRTWALRRTLRLLRQCARGVCLGELSEVHLEDGRGVVVYPAAPRVPIVLGWGGWSTKLERAERALRAWPGAPERLAGLDVRFQHQVVLTLRPLPVPPPPPSARPRARGIEA
jgi:cell division protein FtsQ